MRCECGKPVYAGSYGAVHNMCPECFEKCIGYNTNEANRMRKLNRRIWDKAQDNTLCILLGEGKTKNEIAKIMNRNESGIYQRALMLKRIGKINFDSDVFLGKKRKYYSSQVSNKEKKVYAKENYNSMKKWTPEEESFLREGVVAGKEIKELAKVLGRSEWACVIRLRRIIFPDTKVVLNKKKRKLLVHTGGGSDGNTDRPFVNKRLVKRPFEDKPAEVDYTINNISRSFRPQIDWNLIICVFGVLITIVLVTYMIR